MNILMLFLLMFCLLLPLAIILVGRNMKKNVPKKINNIGYKTNMSMKNEDTWKFAHNYCGNLWIGLGMVMMIISGIVLVFLVNKGSDIFCITGSLIVIIQTVILVLSIFIVEKALKNNFDKYGNKK